MLEKLSKMKNNEMLNGISFRGNEPTGPSDVKIIRRLAEIALSKLGNKEQWYCEYRYIGNRSQSAYELDIISDDHKYSMYYQLNSGMLF